MINKILIESLLILLFCLFFLKLVCLFLDYLLYLISFKTNFLFSPLIILFHALGFLFIFLQLIIFIFFQFIIICFIIDLSLFKFFFIVIIRLNLIVTIWSSIRLNFHLILIYSLIYWWINLVLITLLSFTLCLI